MKKLICVISVMLVTTTNFLAQQKDFPKLTGPYLGQKPPGMTPELFAEDIVKVNRNRCFSKNGDHFFFVHVIDRGEKEDYIDYHMQIKNGKWTVPVLLDFNFNVPVKYPFFHPNGEKVLFTTYLSCEKKKSYDIDICIADYQNGEFSNMKILDSLVNTSAPEAHPTVSIDGTIYFYSFRENGIGGADIYYSELIDGKYQPALNIGDKINTVGDEYNPFIAPDGSYLMFNTPNRNGTKRGCHNIFISFKDEDGSWTEAVNAGDKINSLYDEWAAFVTSDGKYLFFTSRKRSKGKKPDIYWVDAKVIEEIRFNKSL